MSPSNLRLRSSAPNPQARMRNIPVRYPVALALAVASLATATAKAESETGTEFQRVLAGFGQINTIAGRGFADNCNGWNASMETGPASQAELSRPHMAQADAAGNVFIADKEGFALRMVKPDGSIHTVAGNGLRGNGGEGVATNISLREPNGLYTFPDGTTFILEIDDECGRPDPDTFTPGGKIRRLGTDGMLTTIIDDPALIVGRGLWVSPDESLIYYCSGTTVKKWSSAGGLKTFATGFTQLGNLDIDPLSGQVCVTDRGTHVAYRISADGSAKTAIAGSGATGNAVEGDQATATALDQVRGIAFRPDGSFFVCTHKGEQAVWFVDTTGLIWKFIDGNNNSHNGDGTPIPSRPQNVISEPRAITIAPNGDLLITENDEGFIRRVTNICVEPKIIDFVVQPGQQATITFRSHREGNYAIQQSGDLRTWTAILDVETSNGPTTTVSVGPSNTRDFFRVSSL